MLGHAGGGRRSRSSLAIPLAESSRARPPRLVLRASYSLAECLPALSHHDSYHRSREGDACLHGGGGGGPPTLGAPQWHLGSSQKPLHPARPQDKHPHTAGAAPTPRGVRSSLGGPTSWFSLWDCLAFLPLGPCNTPPPHPALQVLWLKGKMTCVELYFF